MSVCQNRLKSLPGTDTPAYYGNSKVTGKKSLQHFAMVFCNPLAYLTRSIVTKKTNSYAYQLCCVLLQFNFCFLLLKRPRLSGGGGATVAQKKGVSEIKKRKYSGFVPQPKRRLRAGNPY